MIIASGPRSESEYLELSKLAPTVVIDEGGAAWKLNLVWWARDSAGPTTPSSCSTTTTGAWRASAPRSRPTPAWLPTWPRTRSRRPSWPTRAWSACPAGKAGARLQSAVWDGPGGLLAARAALADLQRVLRN